ncbi:hypothetical protein PHMEG_0007640 [Phytophthora megakarya]|uniref:Uncharacterized protein n=1 Tax=Phytophthora megakarya TaxID=4795 RepID=A0A225WN18_9STRA|nr:hypothetical protein PHMEG_0007640 [Phytophthora megakarya]
MNSLCLFNAFKKAGKRADCPDIVTDDEINSFVDFDRQYYDLSLTRDMPWKVLRFRTWAKR